MNGHDVTSAETGDETGEERVVAPMQTEGDTAEIGIRPATLDAFIGQRKVCENLRVFITAAAHRGESLDHVLLHGPPGLGKTTMAQIVARELGVGFRATSGPVVGKPGDLAAILTNLQARDVLFIDEIHRLSPTVEEVLYPAMEDFKLDLIIGEGPAARSIRIDLPPFTLVGATTRAGLITTPMRERFGIPLRLNFYETEDLEKIVRRGAAVLGMELTDDGAGEIARRSRGTPRVAVRLLRRVRDFAAVSGAEPGRRGDGRRGPRSPGSRSARARRHGQALSSLHRRQLPGRTGGGRYPGGGTVRTTRYHRGDDRAVSYSARVYIAHAPRPGAGRSGLPASRSAVWSECRATGTD